MFPRLFAKTMGDSPLTQLSQGQPDHDQKNPRSPQRPHSRDVTKFLTEFQFLLTSQFPTIFLSLFRIKPFYLEFSLEDEQLNLLAKTAAAKLASLSGGVAPSEV